LRETACAVSLSQTQNRQLQPKRYATCQESIDNVDSRNNT
jgi:hypothetical protein